MGRKRIMDDKRKVDTKIRIREDLKKESILKGINFSRVMEDSLLKILNKK